MTGKKSSDSEASAAQTRTIRRSAIARPDADYKQVRSLVRGLEVLRALSHFPGGRATASELAALVGIHRTTVRRLLETLGGEGYVTRSPSDDTFRLSIKVRELSSGFTDEAWVSAVAAPVLGELLAAVIWPSDLTAPEGHVMAIRESTHRFSPLSFHHGMVGQSVPMLRTAAGRAWFAHAAEAERARILELVREHGDAEDREFVRYPWMVDKMVETVRHAGYATNDGEWRQQAEVGAVALPIFCRGKPLASINIIYRRHALTPARAVAQYLPHLKAAADRIERALAAQKVADARDAWPGGAN